MNLTKARLLAGELALGAAVRLARGPEVAVLFKTAGLDWMFLDLEHGPLSVETSCQLALAAKAVGLTPIARVPRGDYAMATRLLDNGVLGMIMPHVNTAEEARRMVTQLCLPPIGARSVYGGMPQFGFAPREVEEASRILNRETLIVAMIENAEGIENAAAIAAVSGVDVLFVGANDLCADMSITHADPRFLEAVAAVGRAATDHGKVFGIGGLYDQALLTNLIASGAMFILAGADMSFALTQATRVVARLRAVPLPSRSGEPS